LIGEKQTQNSKADLPVYQIGVKESIGDVTLGLARLLAAEIVLPPFSAMRKAPIKVKKRFKRFGILYSDAYRTISTALHSWQTTGKNGGEKRRIHRW
jgi:hypothetical protein